MAAEFFGESPGVEEDGQSEEFESEDGGPHAHEIGAPVDEQSDDPERSHYMCPEEAAAEVRTLGDRDGFVNVTVDRVVRAAGLIEDLAGHSRRLFDAGRAVAPGFVQSIEDEACFIESTSRIEMQTAARVVLEHSILACG